MKKKYPIYKYFRINKNLISSLSNNYLWFSTSNELNDPFELYVKYPKKGNGINEQIEILIEKLISNIKEIKNDSISKEFFREMFLEHPELIEKILRPSFELNAKNFGICSFTVIPDDILMWSHYADSHKGIVIEFDLIKLISSLVKLNLDRIIEFDYVEYVDEFPHLVLGRLTEKEAFAELKKMFWTKLSKWKYEKEMRIISSIKGKVKFDTSSITKVIIGNKTSKKNIELISDLFKKIKTSENFRIIQSKLDLENGKILIDAANTIYIA